MRLNSSSSVSTTVRSRSHASGVRRWAIARAPVSPAGPSPSCRQYRSAIVSSPPGGRESAKRSSCGALPGSTARSAVTVRARWKPSRPGWEKRTPRSSRCTATGSPFPVARMPRIASIGSKSAASSRSRSR